MWECLENIGGLAGVPALWQAWLAGNFAGFNAAFLRKRPGQARSYPCPRECGCAHEIIARRDGSLVAVCRCEPWNCEDFTLTAAEAVVLELNWSRLGRSLCGALLCDVRDTDLGVSKARQIGAFSTAAVPVVLSIQTERDDFRTAVAGVAARLGKLSEWQGWSGAAD